MKKTLLIILFSLTLTIIGCQKKEEKKEYKVGDIITVDGIVYEYAFLDVEQSEVFSFATQNDDILYHDYYYYDMVDTEQKPIQRYPRDMYSEENFNDVLRVSDVSYYLSDVKYFRLQEYLYGGNYPAWQNGKLISGFIVKGYTDKLKSDVVIGRSIDKYKILGIGYRAFKGAKMKTLTITSDDSFILPGGISDCDYLERVSLTYKTVLFSTAIANNPKLTEVINVGNLVDAAFYNLPSLTSVTFDMFDKAPRDVGGAQIGNLKVGPPIGIYRSPFYLCPKLENFVGPSIHEIDNVVYDIGYRNCCILYVKDDYLIDVDKISFWQAIVDSRDNTVTPYFFNNGLYLEGELYNSIGTRWFNMIDGQMYIRPAWSNHSVLQYVPDQNNTYYLIKTNKWG